MDKGNFYFDLKDCDEVKEVVIRHGDALPLHEPKSISILGTIDAPRLFLEKRHSLVKPLESHILVDREAGLIWLLIDETSAYGGCVKGKLEETKIWKSFNINNGKEFTPKELAKFFKMNRAYFHSKADAMKLIDSLMNFEAKVNSDIQAKSDNKGSKRELQDQVVETNLPEDFELNLPLFKGTPNVKFKVEIYISADDLRCQLVSPEANEVMVEFSENIIDNQLIAISDLCPSLAIINV